MEFVVLDRSQSNLTCHSLMFTQTDDALDVRKYFFSNRVVSEWNCLSGEMLMLGFKKKLV